MPLTVPRPCDVCRPEYDDCMNAGCYWEQQAQAWMRRAGAVHDTDEVRAEIVKAITTRDPVFRLQCNRCQLDVKVLLP